MISEHTTPEIEDSWNRCINQHHLDLCQSLKSPRLTDSETRYAREKFDELFHPAMPVFKALGAAGKKHQYTIYASDTSGTLLGEYSGLNPSFQLPDQVLEPGCVVTEEHVGTNGIGTCLANGKAISVHAGEHFSTAFHELVCSSAPLFSSFGEISGAINVSEYAYNDKAQHQRALKFACDAASEIEATIFRSTYTRYHLIHLTSQIAVSQAAGYSGCSNAILAVNDSGWILGATSSALHVLGLSKGNVLVGQTLTSVFGYALEDLYRSKNLPLQNRQSENTGWYLALVEKQAPNIVSYNKAKAEKRMDSPLYQAAGGDSRLKRNADVCHKVLNKPINILLMGETGTGKEVWARAIHDSSERCKKPFVTLNCAAIPESLIESELFGYSAGTFTGGLKKGKTGKIEASSGGTLFLDEIGDMPLALQARLLRVLAEGEVTPLGQLEPVKVNLNVICATHRNLTGKVEEGSFREDLYYRISGVSLTLSALRERSDRSEIIKKVLTTVSENAGISIDNYAMSVLNKYYWPGNIRQLKNVLNFAVSMCDGSIIRIIDLPEEVFSVQEESKTPENKALESQASESHASENNAPEKKASSVAKNEIDSVKEPEPHTSEKDQILTALETHRWVVLHAAKSLGISRSTLHRKIKQYGLNQAVCTSD